MKRVVFLAAGAVFLTATIAMAGPGNGNFGNGSNGQSNGVGNGAGNGVGNGANNGANKGKKADSNPAAEIGDLPVFSAGAAGLALFKSFDVKPKGEQSAPAELSLPEAKPFTLY